MPATLPAPGNLRLIVSVCKSGSTALIHSLAHAEGVTCYMQTVKSGQRMRGRPDYGVFRHAHAGVAIAKETIGPNAIEDCTLAVFPDDAAIVATRPVFLLRDPWDAWSSWSRSGWGDLPRFVLAYGHLLDLLDRAHRLGSGYAFPYEAFGRGAGQAFRSLCDLLGIGYTPSMVDWTLRFPEQTPVVWRADVQADVVAGLSDSARRSTGFRYRNAPGELPGAEREVIEQAVGKRWRAVTWAIPNGVSA